MSRHFSASLNLLAAIIFCTSASTHAADDPKPAEPGHLVAILDYDEVFKNSLRYKKELEKLKASTVKAENEHKTRNEVLHKLEETLKIHAPGSPDFLKVQEEATLKKHELQAWIQIERTKFEAKRVQLEAAVMKEIDDITKQISIENNIAMVTNVSTRRLQFHDLESTERHRQRPVVFFNTGLDLTQLVLTKLNNIYSEEAKIPVEKRTTNGATRPGPSIEPAAPAKE